MTLHEARVAHTVGGSRDPDTALGFLQNHGQNEAMIDLGLLSDLLNGALDVCGLGRRVVLAPAIVGT